MQNRNFKPVPGFPGYTIWDTGQITLPNGKEVTQSGGAVTLNNTLGQPCRRSVRKLMRLAFNEIKEKGEPIQGFENYRITTKGVIITESGNKLTSKGGNVTLYDETGTAHRRSLKKLIRETFGQTYITQDGAFHIFHNLQTGRITIFERATNTKQVTLTFEDFKAAFKKFIR